MADTPQAPAAFVVFTDGGCHPNPGRGGWGVVVLQGGRVVQELSGGEADTTNNRMELTAAAEALRALPDGARAEIHTDSTYVRNGISKWIADWRRRGWRTQDGGAVKNQDLWQALDALAAGREVQWHWVRGHAGNKHNERADALAAAAIRGEHGRAVQVQAAAATTATVDLFCAVSFAGKTGRGSWAAVLRYGEAEKVLTGTETDTTANRLCLLAVLRGLEGLTRPLPVRVFCASDYVVDGATRWLATWQARAWLTREGKPVLNRDLWEALAPRLLSGIEWVATGGVAPPPLMEKAKQAASEARALGAR